MPLNNSGINIDIHQPTSKKKIGGKERERGMMNGRRGLQIES